MLEQATLISFISKHFVHDMYSVQWSLICVG